MKKRSYSTKKYVAAFLLFSAFFCAALLLFGSLGKRLGEETDTQRESQPNEHGVTVVIDAGHGGEDGGTVGVNGAYEKNLNLSIAKKLGKTLEAKGVNAVLTRDEDILLYDKNSDHVGHKKEQDLLNRRRIAEGYENAIFVSIHMNSFPDPKYSGLQVYYSSNDQASASLAGRIQSITRQKLMPENQRQIKKDDGSIYLLDRLNCPAVLVECGFLSNPAECDRLCDEGYQRDLSTCIADAIIEHINSQKDMSGT